MTFRVYTCLFAFISMSVLYKTSDVRADAGLSTLVVLGDSISAGTMADTHAKPSRMGLDFYLEALENKDTLSWASGLKVNSHFSRFLKEMGKDRVQVKNLAVPGAQSKDLPSQVHEIAKLMSPSTKIHLEYVTLFMGNNDLCTKRPMGNDEAANVMLKSLGDLAESLKGSRTRVLVTGLPRIPDLGFEEIRKSGSSFWVSCETLRRLYPMCTHLINWNDSSEYQDAIKVVEEKNRSIEQVVARAKELYPNLDLYFSDKLFHMDIKAELLAGDCFHPNQKGQQMISDALWEEQPWFKF